MMCGKCRGKLRHSCRLEVNMDKWRAPLEVYDDVMKTDWTTITLAEACRVTDADIYEVIGKMVCPRLLSCGYCPVGLHRTVDSRECKELLGKTLLEKGGKHENKQRSSSRGRSKGLA